MAKRASLDSQKAGSVLNLPKQGYRAGSLDQIGSQTATAQRVIEEIPVTRLRANPFQPRWAIDEATVNDIADSIEKRGFFGSLVARKRGRWYEIAFGHQRLEAARRAELATLPIETKELSDEEMLEYALAENMQRKDLSQLEEGEIFQRWQNELGRSQREIAASLGKSRGYVRNRIETAQLPDDLKNILRTQATQATTQESDESTTFELSPAAAKALARIEDQEQRQQATSQTLSNQLNYKQTQALIEEILTPPTESPPRDLPSPQTPPQPKQPFNTLMRRLEKEAQRIPLKQRDQAVVGLTELIARAEQLLESLKIMR